MMLIKRNELVQTLNRLTRAGGPEPLSESDSILECRPTKRFDLLLSAYVTKLSYKIGK